MSQSKLDGANGGTQAVKGKYFLSLTLKNIRCFGKETQRLDLSDGNGRPARWTVLLGNNGVGKTTILQALARLRHYSTGDEHLEESAIGKTSWMPGDFDISLLRRGEQSVGRLEASAISTAHLLSASRQSPEEKCDIQITISKSNNLICSFGPSEVKTPYCFAYGAGRRMGRGALSEPEIDDPTASLFTDRVELRNAEEWFLQTDYTASKPSEYQEQQKKYLKWVTDLLLHIFPPEEVSDIRCVVSGGAWAKTHVEFETPYGWVPLRQLGHGYRTLIAWMVDFASRMVERYPDSPDPLAEPAVVLVDEIDLHLHPTWQRQLLGYLTERFPNTQFIATAHSPLIVQAAGDANLVLLRREGDHVVIDNNPENLRGWSVDQILTSDLYGLPSPYPPRYDERIARREALLDKPKLTKADEKELKRLDEALGELLIGDTATRAKDTQAIRQAIKALQEGAERKP